MNNEILSFVRYRTSSQEKLQYKKDLDSLIQEHQKEESERRQKAKYGQHSLEALVCYSMTLPVEAYYLQIYFSYFTGPRICVCFWQKD